ncbi:MAG: DNA-directed RNA polymerase subunit beta [Candidatus Nomurabacteria bacterium]|nr:DNA-directed RNA polymerase subunit beta [Candidatus Nomurabacteria bacterium]
MAKSNIKQKTFAKYKKPLVKMPNLVENQLKSFEWFLQEGLKKTILEFVPITDYAESKFEMNIDKLTLGEPEHGEYYCKENKLTYSVPLAAEVRLYNKKLDDTQTQEIFMTDIPMMTDHGTFIINGAERVIIPQLARSYGIFFTSNEVKGKTHFGAKIIPERGAWAEIETEKDNAIYVKIDKKRKFPVTSLLRIFGLETDAEILKTFKGTDAESNIQATIEKDDAKTVDQAYLEIYKRLRDGEIVSIENAREFVGSIFSVERYNLSEVGRYQFNKRFGQGIAKKDLQNILLTKEDMIKIVSNIGTLNVTEGSVPDDIDHLGFRRVRFVGEMLLLNVRKGMMQIRRNIQDKMSTIDNDTLLPIQLVNQRPLQARVKEYFATNQLSKFMDQENALAEIEDLRTLSALGPGGLSRERAGFEVRDVHPSHYGRVCPIHTPEGPNIGLILRLAVYARPNQFGMIETPYSKVEKGKITKEIVFLNAHEEMNLPIAHQGVKYDDSGKLLDDLVEARLQGEPTLVPRNEIKYIDIATNQAFSVATNLIPFLEHDDANRSLMGSNMQKQATPCIVPMAPLVATGMEEQAARDTGRVVIAVEDGTVTAVDGRHIVIKGSNGKGKEYHLVNFNRTNNHSMFHQRPNVSVGDKVKSGDVIADATMTVGGQLAIGQNILMAFMCWNGLNYEDAIIISERLVKNSIFTSVRIDEYECVVRDTKLGPEMTTHDIPNVGESKLKNLDEEGVVRIGAELHEGDIMVGKITPKGETELTPEERLLRSIFGEKARDVKDTSIRLGHGKTGRVIGIKVFSRENGHQLESGILKKIYVEVAQMRNIQVGDKLAGRHGNKGVISTVLPEEDMPYMEDGTPIDLILTPMGVPSRMNLGQILEMHLGLAANTLGYQAIVPAFQGATPDEIRAELDEAGFSKDGKVTLFDGRTGEKIHSPIAVGYMYMLKLHHMVEDKIHARSVGPYSLITQQPLGGKSQAGGQRFGEMEVWALEGYGAAYTLREMLTVKSDDIMGRSNAFDSIIKGNNVENPNIPASFKVMLNYLRGLGLNVEISGVEREERSFRNS